MAELIIIGAVSVMIGNVGFHAAPAMDSARLAWPVYILSWALFLGGAIAIFAGVAQKLGGQ